MKRGRQLIENFIVFALGTLGSKLIALFLLPVYTHYLTPSDFGIVDVSLVAVDLIAAVAALGIHESVLRYTMLDPETADESLSNGLAVTLCAVALVAIIGGITYAHSTTPVIPVFISIIVCLQLIQALFGRYARAVGKVRLFASSGLLQVFVMGTCAVVLIAVLKWGVAGYFTSLAAGIVSSTAVLVVFSGGLKHLRPSKISRKTTIKMARFSLPLVPNAVMWWMISALGRYFLLANQGTAEIGLFSAASRVAAIITMFTTVFAQAWQLSANAEYDSGSRDNFPSAALSRYQLTLFLAAVGLTAVIKPLMHTLVGPNFYPAWQYAPILILSAVFASLSAFLGTAYTAAFRTTGVLTTSIAGALITTMLYATMVPNFGAFGAASASTIGFIMVWALRLRGIRPLIHIVNDWRTTIFGTLAVVAQMAILHSSQTTARQVVIALGIALAFLLVRFKLVMTTATELTSLYIPSKRRPKR